MSTDARIVGSMPRTLADMTPAEQDQCVGMWCELLGASYLVILASPDDPYNGYATVMIPDLPKANTTYTPIDTLTPRFDLPRAWTPDGEPVPGSWEYEYRPWPEGVREPLTEGYARCFVTDWEVAP